MEKSLKKSLPSLKKSSNELLDEPLITILNLLEEFHMELPEETLKKLLEKELLKKSLTKVPRDSLNISRRDF